MLFSFVKIFVICLLFVILPFLSIPNVAYAAITNGSNAIDLLGQYDQTSFTNPVPVYGKSGVNDGPNIFGFNAAYGVSLDSSNHQLFVLDRNNHRVLVYNLTAGNLLSDHVPDNVIGQPNFYSRTPSLSQSGMDSPEGVSVDSGNGRLYVADLNNNRVLLYTTASITNGMNAVNVLGQTTFNANAGAYTQHGMRNPNRVAFDSANNRLYVSDYNNNRVLVYGTSAIINGMNATNVIGQQSFTGTTGTVSQNGMSQPIGIAINTAQNRLYVANSSRVTIYNTASIANGMNAVNVLGQTTFNGSSATVSQSQMSLPYGLVADSVHNRLYVADLNADRVTVYNTASITNGMNAVNVLGQTTFNGSAGAYTQHGMFSPHGVEFDSSNNLLYVANYAQVKIYNTSIIANGENAIDLLGQYDQTSFSNPVPVYAKSSVNDGPNIFGFTAPVAIALDSVYHRLFVADSSNMRVLVYNLTSNNLLADHKADNVIGQSSFYASAVAYSQSGMSNPSGLAFDSDHNRLYVSDFGNHRILVYSTASITNGMNAVNVLGQTTFNANAGAISQRKMQNVQGLVYDSANNRLFAAQGNATNRVTVYDVATITNGENATGVLGQQSFTLGVAATSQAGLSEPVGLAYDSANSRLYVASAGNNRVTVYDAAVISNAENAVNVLGQSSFSGFSGATSQKGMMLPYGVVYDSLNSRLFVAGYGNNRVTVYDVASISNGENAINVLGQANFAGSVSASSQSGMYGPRDMAYDGTNGRLWVVDTENNRVTSYDVSVPDTVPPAPPVASPAGGTYGSTQAVTLTSDEGAPIHYTTDGTVPTASSPLYSSAISVSSTMTINAIAVDSAGNASTVMTEAYAIIIPPTPTPPPNTDISDITYVSIFLIVDADVNMDPRPIAVRADVQLRNLKKN